MHFVRTGRPISTEQQCLDVAVGQLGKRASPCGTARDANANGTGGGHFGTMVTANGNSANVATQLHRNNGIRTQHHAMIRSPATER